MRLNTLHINIFTIITLIIMNLVACNNAVVSKDNHIFTSNKYYMSIQLPEGWAAAEGPEDIVSTGHLEGQVAFNNWGQANFWAHEIVMTSLVGYTSAEYSEKTVMSQIPAGGAYVVLVRIYPQEVICLRRRMNILLAT